MKLAEKIGKKQQRSILGNEEEGKNGCKEIDLWRWKRLVALLQLISPLLLLNA